MRISCLERFTEYTVYVKAANERSFLAIYTGLENRVTSLAP